MANDLRDKMWHAMAQSPVIMMSLDSDLRHSEPMYAQLDEDASGAFWFFTRKDNRLAAGGKALGSFTAKEHGLFASIRGTLVKETDQSVIDRYWSNGVGAWYDDGKEDESLLVLRFELDEAEIWESDPNIKGIFKLMTGMSVDESDMGDHKTLPLN